MEQSNLMSFEQIEGHLASYEGKQVSVAVPIRGTVCANYFGNLVISHDWENHRIYYSVRFYPDADLNFQSHDVHKIIPTPTPELEAAIILKSDVSMEQLDYNKL